MTGTPETETPPLRPPLDEYARQFEALAQEATGLVDGLDRQRLNGSPKPGEQWSVGQCLEHLATVNRKYGRRLEAGIDRAWERGLVERPERGVRYGWFERWFLGSLEPPPKRRFSAPKAVVPASDLDLDVLDRYLESNQTLRGLIVRASGLDISRAKITSPLSKLLKLRLGAAFAILAAHDRRHLWQAQRILDQQRP